MLEWTSHFNTFSFLNFQFGQSDSNTATTNFSADCDIELGTKSNELNHINSQITTAEIDKESEMARENTK